MSKILNVKVANKIATYRKLDGAIVCGNSDYQVKFAFDEEWDAHNQKTARFIWGGQFIDVPFTGDTCNVPIIQNTDEVKIGVYAGDLQTTTSAVIGCHRSILCEGATPSVENDKHYANEAKEAADRAEEAANNVEHALTEAKESGEFDGKSAYKHAQDGGYLGTEEEFNTKLATDYIDWFGLGISIPEGADLDTYKTDGKYYVNSESRAKSLLNRPDGMNTNFVMWVFTRTTSTIKSQLMITLSGKMYIRSSSSSAWRAWVAYTTSAEIEAIRAELFEELITKPQIIPNFANDISECTDTNKLYVLPDGFIYAYMNRTTTLPETNPNLYDVGNAVWNGRLSGSSGSLTTNANNSCTATGFIELTDFTEGESFIVRIKGVNFDKNSNHGDDKVVFYDSAKARIGNVGLVSGVNITYSDTGAVIDLKAGEISGTYSGAVYIRMQFATTQEEYNDLIITFDTNYVAGGTVTQTGWLSTGHAFVPTDYEDRILELEKKDNLLGESIYELQQKINKTNTDIEIPSFWENAVNECISKIKALQVGIHCVTFPFFSDNHQRNGYSGVLIAKIMKECHIPYAFFGGDSIDSGYIASEAVMIAQDRAFDETVSYIPNGRFCRAVGNHDGYWAVSANEKYYYTDSQIYELFLREESVAQNKHFGGDGTYYYVDDIASKVRWIVLDTNDGTVEAEQIAWLQNTALSFGESGWAVVFISHQPISNHYHAGIGNAEAVRTVVANYINGTATNKADVVGWFSGHIHRDRIYTGVAVNTTDDSEGETMPFKQVTITSDHTGIAYDDATKHTVANDDKSHAIDFVTINKSTRTVNLTRLGIGNDRSYSY